VIDAFMMHVARSTMGISHIRSLPGEIGSSETAADMYVHLPPSIYDTQSSCATGAVKGPCIQIKQSKRFQQTVNQSTSTTCAQNVCCSLPNERAANTKKYKGNHN
jgi:hypothetical protein